MTYKEILDKFREDFPEAKVRDYRPADALFIHNRVGITVWLDNAVVIYSPDIKKEDK